MKVRKLLFIAVFLLDMMSVSQAQEAESLGQGEDLSAKRDGGWRTQNAFYVRF